MSPPLNNPPMTLAICEPHHPTLHGLTQSSTPGVPGHFLLLEKVSNGEWEEEGAGVCPPQPPPCRVPHPLLRNYRSLSRVPRMRGLHIVKEYTLSGGESVAVIHTGAIRRLQKKWRSHMASFENEG